MQAKISPPGGRVLRATTVLLLGFVAGCGPKPADTPTAKKAHADAVVKVWCADERLGEVFGSRAKAWAFRHGAKVELVKGEADADLLLVPPARLGKFDPPTALQSVPASVAGENADYQWGDLLGVYQSRLAHWGAERYAVPLVGEGHVLVYRADVLADPAFVTAFREKHNRPPLPIRTWDELGEVGAFATARAGKPGLPPLPADPAAAVATLGHVAACYDRLAATGGGGSRAGSATDTYFRGLSFYTDVDVLRNNPGKQWEVRFAAPAFAEAFRWFEKTRDARPPEPGDPAAAVTTGTAVAAVLPLSDLAKLPKDTASGAVDAKFGVGSVPGSESYFDADGKRQKTAGVNRIPHYTGGGLVGVVRKSASHSESAWALLAELGGPLGSTATMDTPAVGGGPIRIDHADDAPRLWQQYGFDKARTEDLNRAMREYVARGTINPAVDLRTPDVDAINALLARHLLKVAKGEVTADAGHQQAVKEWRELDDKTPTDQRVNQRRKSAGLD